MYVLVFSLTIKVSGRIISSRNYVAKDISFGVGARAAMLQGVSEVAEAVKVTMGPKVVYIFFSEGLYIINAVQRSISISLLV